MVVTEIDQDDQFLLRNDNPFDFFVEHPVEFIEGINIQRISNCYKEDALCFFDRKCQIFSHKGVGNFFDDMMRQFLNDHLVFCYLFHHSSLSSIIFISSTDKGCCKSALTSKESI